MKTEILPKQPRPPLIGLLALISGILIAVFSVTLVTSYFFPIYPDEIAVRVWLSRSIYDFPEKISIYPTCEGFLQKLPVTWILPGLIEWAIHGNLGDLRILRLLGIIGALLLISMLVRQLVISDCVGNTISGARKLMSCRSILCLTGVVISIISIGVVPIFLVTNRQEQIVLPLVVLLLALFVNLEKHSEVPIPKKKIVSVMSAYLIAVSLILYSHPKGIFLSPFFVLIGYRLFHRFRSLGLMVLGALVVLALLVQSYFAWKYTFQCAKNPTLDSLLKSFYIDPTRAMQDPWLFFEELLRSLWNFDKYITQLSFQQYTDASYLPSIPVEKFAAFANLIIQANALVVFLCALVFPLFFYVRDVSRGRLISTNLVLIVLLACVLLGASLNLAKNWYDAGYLYVMLVIVCVFFLVDNVRRLLQNPLLVAGLICLGCAAIFSQAVFNYRYLPAFLEGFAGPGVSVKTYDYQEALHDISASCRACAIDPVASKGIIFDDYTYFFFQESQKPMAITYIYFLNDQAAVDFIAESGSAGMVIRCAGMPKSYVPYANKTGSVCCVPRDALRKITKDGLPNL